MYANISTTGARESAYSGGGYGAGGNGAGSDSSGGDGCGVSVGGGGGGDMGGVEDEEKEELEENKEEHKEEASPPPPPPALGNYRIAIPTYNRVDVFSKQTYSQIIQRYGLESITDLFLQSDADEQAYRRAFPNLNVVRSPPGLLDTVNFINTHYPLDQWIVLLHDDVKQFVCVSPGDSRLQDVADINAVLVHVFEELVRHNFHLGGFYMTANDLWMGKSKAVTTGLTFIHDPITLLINCRVVLDDKWKTDFQRSIEYYKQDGGVFRFNHYAFKTKHKPPATAGGIGHRNAQQEKEAAENFRDRYPSLSRI